MALNPSLEENQLINGSMGKKKKIPIDVFGLDFQQIARVHRFIGMILQQRKCLLW